MVCHSIVEPGDRLHPSTWYNLLVLNGLHRSLALPDGARNLHWFLLRGTTGEPTRLVGTLVAQHTAAAAAMAARRVVCSDDPALRLVTETITFEVTGAPAAFAGRSAG